MAGLKETKEVLKAIAALTNATGLSLEDKKFELGDVAFFIPALIELPLAVENYKLVVDEIKDLSNEEKVELQVFVATELNIPQERTEQYIEAVFNLMGNLYLLVSEFYKFVKQPA